jgi:pyruvate/2-oxoglutarate dehydrogenase complex dihydrolipoamide acyltransferase (E2) component
VDLNSVQSFNFWTKDKTGDYYTSLTKTYLIDTPRYCYYSLPDNFDYDTGAGNELAVSDKVWVPTVIALSDDWNRSLAGASFGSDYTNLNTGTRFRLIFGQTDAQERTASRSAKWIYAIEVTLGGAPPEAAPELPDDEVGSAFTSESGGDSQGDDAAAAAPETPAAAETPPERTTPTEPDPAPDPIPEPAPEIRALPLGYEIRPVANSLRDDGGVQQWRRDEMSQDATELPDIYKDAPVAQAAAAAFAVFILGAALQAAVINGNFSLAMGVSRK